MSLVQIDQTTQGGTNGVSLVTPATLLYTDLAAVTKDNIKGAAGKVYSLHVSNANAAARFLLLHNKATAPVATNVPLYAFYIPPASSVTIGTQFFTTSGAAFSLGIGFSISTTAATFTDSATAGEHVLALLYG